MDFVFFITLITFLLIPGKFQRSGREECPFTEELLVLFLPGYFYLKKKGEHFLYWADLVIVPAPLGFFRKDWKFYKRVKSLVNPLIFPGLWFFQREALSPDIPFSSTNPWSQVFFFSCFSGV